MDLTAHDTCTFSRMEAEAPDLARRTRDRFAASGLCLLATHRADGWPRISPVEPIIMEGQLYLGMMPGSSKSRDLARDARCLVHSTVADKDGTEGEVKLYGLARRISDPDETERYLVVLEEAIGWRPDGPDDFDLWCIDLTQAAHQIFGGDPVTHQVTVWRPGHQVRSASKEMAI